MTALLAVKVLPVEPSSEPAPSQLSNGLQLAGITDYPGSSLPLWTVADTRVTSLIEFSDRRAHVQTLLQRMMKP